MEEEILETSPSKGKALRLAQIISRMMNPLFIAPPLFLVVALETSQNTIQGLIWWAIIGIGVSVAPVLFIRRGVRLGDYTDHHVSRREQRLIPLLFAIGCMVVVFLLLVLMNASIEIIGTVTAMILSFVIALTITHFARWKISLHLIGISGAIVTLGLAINSLLLLLSPLIVLVGWSRWRVRAHNPLQACVGALVAVVVTIAVFCIYGII